MLFYLPTKRIIRIMMQYSARKYLFLKVLCGSGCWSSKKLLRYIMGVGFEPTPLSVTKQKTRRSHMYKDLSIFV
jgi:hypothetical protein